MTVHTMLIPSMVMGIGQAILKQTPAACVVHDIAGHVIYANDGFSRLFPCDSDSRYAAEQVGAPLWDAWRIDALQALQTRCALEHVAEHGILECGLRISSRCADWDPDSITERIGMIYTQVLPLSARRGLVARWSLLLNSLLKLVPDDTFNPAITIVDTKKGAI